MLEKSAQTPTIASREAAGPIPQSAESPSIGDIRTKKDLSTALGEIRARAKLSIRDVVRLSGGQHGTVAGWFSGQHIPTRSSYKSFAAVLTACGIPGTEHEQWWHAVEECRKTTQNRSATGTAPYLGLESYTSSDSDLFFGRAELAQRITDSALHSNTGLPLVVIGASGSGKSSLCAAAVAPKIEHGIGGPVVISNPAQHGLVLPEASDENGGAIIIDQFEEIWASSAESMSTVREQFISDIFARASTGTVVILVLRADFFEIATSHQLLRTAIDENSVVVGPLTTEELRSVIEDPARKLGYTVDPALVSLLIELLSRDGAMSDPGLLPLLSHVLLRAWKASTHRTITASSYYQAGGIDGAIRDSADETFATLTSAQQDATRSLLLRSVTVERSHLTRRRVALAELSDAELDAATAFAGSGLLTLDADSVTATHEAFLHAWPRLASWIAEGRDDLQVLSRIRSGTQEWKVAGKNANALPSPHSAATFAQWALSAANRQILGPEERQFLADTATHHEIQADRDRRRVRVLSILSAALTVAFLLAIAAGVTAVIARNDVAETRDIAQSRTGALASTALAERDPSLSRLLALASYRISPTLEAHSALLDSSSRSTPHRYRAVAGAGRVIALTGTDAFATATSDGEVRIFGNPRVREPSAQFTAITGPSERVDLFATAYQAEQSILAVAGSQGLALWGLTDLDNPVALTQELDVGGTIYDLSFSPSGRRLAAASSDGSVHIWEGSAGKWKQSTAVDLDQGVINSVRWLGDSTVLAVADSTSIQIVEDADTSTARTREDSLASSSGSQLLTIAVSNDQRSIAAGNKSGEVLQWTLKGPAKLEGAQQRKTLEEFSSYVNGITYLRGGVLAAISSDETLRTFSQSGEPLDSVSVSQVGTTVSATDDGHLLTWSVDGYVRSWPPALPQATQTQGRIVQAFTSEDFTRAVYGRGPIEVASVIDGRPQLDRLLSPSSDVVLSGAIALTTDNQHIVTGTGAGVVQIYPVSAAAPYTPGQPSTSTRALGEVQAADSTIVSVRVTADNTIAIACSQGDKEVAIINISDKANPRKVATLPTQDPCNEISVSPKTPTLLAVPTVGGATDVVDLTDMSSPQQAAAITYKAGVSPASAFSYTADILYLSNGEERLQSYDISDPSNPRRIADLPAPSGEIYSLSTSADGKRLVAASSSGLTWMYSTDNDGSINAIAKLGQEFGPAVYDADFTSADNGVMSVGTEGHVRSWKTNVDEVIADTCRGGALLNEQEWQRHLPDAEPREIC